MWENFLVFWIYGCYDFLKPFQTPRGVLQLGSTEGIGTKASVAEDRELESPHRIRTPGYPPVTLLPAPGDVKEPPPPPSAVSPPRPGTTPPPPPGTETAAAAAVQQTPSLNIINSGLVHNKAGVIDETDQTNNNDTATVSKAGPETESSENKMNLVCGTVASDSSEAGGSDNKAVSGLTPDPALTSVLPHTIRERTQCTQS